MSKVFRVVSAGALLVAAIPLSALAQVSQNVQVQVQVQGNCTVYRALQRQLRRANAAGDNQPDDHGPGDATLQRRRGADSRGQ